jgi:hypothetical protein
MKTIATMTTNNNDNIGNDNKDNNDDDNNKDNGNNNDLFETAWSITPTSVLRLTFNIENNDNTKDDRAIEERG